jgi:hypothetical protein
MVTSQRAGTVLPAGPEDPQHKGISREVNAGGAFGPAGAYNVPAQP